MFIEKVRRERGRRNGAINWNIRKPSTTLVWATIISHLDQGCLCFCLSSSKVVPNIANMNLLTQKSDLVTMSLKPGLLNLDTTDTVGRLIAGEGRKMLSCALKGILYPLSVILLLHPLSHHCDEEKCFYRLPNVPWRQNSSFLPQTLQFSPSHVESVLPHALTLWSHVLPFLPHPFCCLHAHWLPCYSSDT